MKTPLRVGISGAGWAAQFLHLPFLASHNDIGIVGIYDTNQDRAHNFAQIADSFAFRSFEELLNEELDVLVVASDSRVHGHQTIQALRRGVNVICEKPLTLSQRESKLVLNAADSTRARLICCMTLRHRYDVQRLKLALSQGAIGKPRQIDLSWTRAQGLPRSQAILETGVMWDLGSHLVDLGLWLSGWAAPFQAVRWDLPSMDASNSMFSDWHGVDGVTLKHQTYRVSEGLIIAAGANRMTVHCSWQTMQPFDRSKVSVFGDDGVIELESLFGMSNHGDPKLRPVLRIGKPGLGWANIPIPQQEKGEEYRLQLAAAFHSINEVDGGEDGIFSLQETLNSISIIEGAASSWIDGRHQ